MTYISYGDDVKRALGEAVDLMKQGIGQEVTSRAKALAPVDTGWLRQSISYETSDKEVVIGTNVEYAPEVEMGTSKQRAQPYLYPGAIESAPNIKRLAEMILRRMLGGSA